MRWAFSDESRRGNRLVLVAAVIETHDVNAVRGQVRAFLRPNQRRVHMAKESPARRRQFAAMICGLPIQRCVVATGLSGRSIPSARERLVGALAVELVGMGVESWVIEAIGQVQERLGNGHCTRPAALDCQFETICERCGFYDTGPQFVEILRRQHDDAIDHDDHDRAQIFTGLLDGIDDTR